MPRSETSSDGPLRPECPVCGQGMMLARRTPISPRAELALFECPACEKVLARTLLKEFLQPTPVQRIDGKIAEGQFLVSRQEAVVSRRHLAGHDTRAAVSLLLELRRVVENYQRIRATLVKFQAQRGNPHNPN